MIATSLYHFDSLNTNHFTTNLPTIHLSICTWVYCCDTVYLQSKSEEQVKLAEEIMEQFQLSTNEVKKLELELDAVIRERVMDYVLNNQGEGNGLCFK